VARELERRWEEALKQQRHLEEKYERWQRSAPARQTDDDKQAIRSLAADLPAVWGGGDDHAGRPAAHRPAVAGGSDGDSG
jgi:hypothetical protein